MEKLQNFFFLEKQEVKGFSLCFHVHLILLDLSDVSFQKTCFHQFGKNVQVTPKNMENLSIPKLNVNHFIRFQVWRNASQPIFFLLKVNKRNTKTSCEICSKLTIRTPELRQWHCSGVFIVNFEHNSHLVLGFLLTLNL